MSKLNIPDAVAVLRAVAPTLAKGNLFSLHCFDDPFIDSVIDNMEVNNLATELTTGQVLSGPLSPDQAATVEVLMGFTDTIALVYGGDVEDFQGGEEATVAAPDDRFAEMVEQLTTINEREFIGVAGYVTGTPNSECAYGQGGCDCATHIDADLIEAEPSSVGPERADILIDAAVTTTADRNDQYGDPENSFPDIAALWTAHLGYDVSPHDVAILMALMKIARTNAGYKRDSYVDAAGYLAIAGELALGEVTQPGSVH